MPIKITGPTIESFLKPVDDLFDPKKFEREVAPKMVTEIKKNVVARFDAQRVGHTKVMKYAVGDTQQATVTDVIATIAEGLKKTKRGSDEYNALVKQYEQVTKDEQRAQDKKKDYMGTDLGMLGDESDKQFSLESTRLPNEAFTTTLKTLIESEPLYVAPGTVTANSAKYTIWIGRLSYFRSHASQIQIPPPSQLKGLLQHGYTPFYQDTLHIQEFGTASKSTDEAPYIKRSPYLWVLVPYIKYHPGKEGRHAYIKESGQAYESDYDTTLNILDAAIKLVG